MKLLSWKSPPVVGEIEKIIMSNENRGRGMKEGWKKVPFEKCLKKISKQNQIKAKDYQETGRYPVVSQDSELICGYYNDESYLYSHEKPVVIFGDHTRNIKYVDFDFIIGADGTQILMPNDDFDSKYFYYSLRSIELRNLGYARHYKLLKERSVYCPPLSEQQSIVAHLDASFAEIDALKAKAAEEVANAKAMFDAALREEMTPKEGWEEKTLGSLSNLITKGASPKWQGIQYVTDDTEGILFVTSENVRDGYVDIKPSKYVEKKINTIQKRSILKNNDLLINIVGASIGRAAIFSLPVENANINQAVALVRCNNGINLHFMLYFLNSDFAMTQYNACKKDTARANLSLKNISDLVIPYPSNEEQHFIVARLDSLRSLLTELKQKYAKIATECDALKQAILRKTFE